MEISNSSANCAVSLAQINRRSPGPIESCNSDPKGAVVHVKTTDEDWDPWRLVIVVLIALFRLHKSTGEVWDPQRLVFLIQKSLFCMQKPQMRAGTHRD